jgi:hypothetical protein
MKLKIYTISIFIILSLLARALFAQETKEAPENKIVLPYGNSLTRDTIPDLSFQPDSTFHKKRKKKKDKRAFFYGKKSRKGYAKEGVDTRQVAELFYVLKKYSEPSDYIDELYVWDLTKRKVVKVRKEELKKIPKYKILHGPYTKYVGGRMMETGIFYIGTKHGRWEKYKWEKKWWEPKPEKYSKVEIMQPILIGKAKYYKGFQREAKISYYDSDRKKVKEVIPSEYGEKSGDYYYFLENGQLLTRGHYGNGKKIGLWIEYFEDKNKRKRETQYPKDQWAEGEPVVTREWDSKGTLIIFDGKKVDLSKKTENDPIKKALKRRGR